MDRGSSVVKQMLANAYEEHGRELKSHQVCRIFYGNSADNDNAASLIYSLFTIVYYFLFPHSGENIITLKILSRIPDILW